MRLLISGSWVRAPRWAPLFSLLIRHFIPVDWTLLPTKRYLEPVYITSEEFGNGYFTLKTHPMFSVHITLGGSDLTTQQSPVILDLCLRKTRSGNFHYCRDAIVLERLLFQMFSVHIQTKNPRFEISVDDRFGGPHKSDCVFKFSGIVCLLR